MEGLVLLALLAVAGFAAQLVDGALGMGYGITSSTILLLIGLSPAAASASVHIAKIGTGASSGLAHHRFGNVDWKVVRRIALPGGIGAFIGATLLSALSTESSRPLSSLLLFALGVYVVLRYLRGGLRALRKGTPRLRFLIPLGLIGGFVDATGGGGWGPVATPALLADGRLAPNRVIGTVSASEFVVAVAASAGFIFGIGVAGVRLDYVAALLAGGLVAAPIAAYLVRHLNPRLLGVIVGGFICFTNARVLLAAAGISGDAFLLIYAAIVITWAGAVAFVVRAIRRERSAESSGV
ncbi:MAG: sulfite exporter TauE/SafE family protein [Candidatus Limnocylindrus sp. ZSMar2m-chloro-G89]|nr:MAG: sulfite exporter TauE/SafE family protein [Candidatus Limnocylindrus sp. ZSMar2m-chloro-G89]